MITVSSGCPDYPTLIRACGNSKDIAQARKVHGDIPLHRATTFIENLIVEMYGKCGGIEEACSVFERMSRRNVFSWTMIIAAFAHNGHHRLALVHFWRMSLEGFKPDLIGFVTVLDSVREAVSPRDIASLHACIAEAGLSGDLIVGNALLNIYTKRFSLQRATEIFEQMPRRDVISWTCLIAANAENGHDTEAMRLYRRMDLEGVSPNGVTHTSICSSYSKLGRTNPEIVEAFVSRVLQSGFLPMVGCSVIEMLGKLGQVDNAKDVFERMESLNVVVWTAMVNMYVQNRMYPLAMEMFCTMELEGVDPDSVTFLGLLDACSQTESVQLGRLIHLRIAEQELECHSTVGNSLVNMYGKCGCIESARAAFEKLSFKTVVTWTCLLTAYAHSGHSLGAFELFAGVDQEGIQPTPVTLVTMLDAASALADVTRGKLIHDSVQTLGYEQDGILGNALVYMYGRCGRTQTAMDIFRRMKFKDFCTWNGMVAAYAHTGHISLAVELVQEMELEGIRATEITFINILSALSHAGSLEACMECLTSMVRDYGVAPVGDHFRCIVDLFARTGQMQLARELMERMPFEPTAPAWMSVLSALKLQSASPVILDQASTAAKHLFELEPENASPYLALSTMCR